MPTIRRAGPEDAAALLPLLGQLGYRIGTEELAGNIAASNASASEVVLVAEDAAGACGLLALQWRTMLHLTTPTARITTLVVDHRCRGTGVGRLLVEAGAEAARAGGCAILELTTALHREDARGFYEALGFRASSLRMHRAP